jgi:hypothetical protein
MGQGEHPRGPSHTRPASRRVPPTLEYTPSHGAFPARPPTPPPTPPHAPSHQMHHGAVHNLAARQRLAGPERPPPEDEPLAVQRHTNALKDSVLGPQPRGNNNARAHTHKHARVLTSNTTISALSHEHSSAG